MRNKRHMLIPAFAALCLAFTATAADAADVFNLKSTTFEDGMIMPKKVANSRANQPNNPNCVGDKCPRSFRGAIRPTAPRAS